MEGGPCCLTSAQAHLPSALLPLTQLYALTKERDGPSFLPPSFPSCCPCLSHPPQVYALTKERDALKKGAEKLGEYSALIKEKDAIIKQVCGVGVEGMKDAITKQVWGLSDS